VELRRVLRSDLSHQAALVEAAARNFEVNYYGKKEEEVVYDPKGKIANVYQLLGMPSSYLIDKKGNVRFAHKGFFTRTQPLYEQELALLLNE
jgi:predicted transcriptional regulator